MLNTNDLWFTWRSYDSRDLSTFTDLQDVEGVKLIVRRFPEITSPKRRHLAYNVNGRNGSIYVPNDTFENITIRIEVFLYTDNQSLPSDKLRRFCKAIAMWLYGGETYYQDPEDNTAFFIIPPGYQRLQVCEEDSYYLAYYTGPMNVENLLYRFGKATLEFSARPEHFTGNDWLRKTYSGSDLGWTFFLSGEDSPPRPCKPVIALNRRYCRNYDINLTVGGLGKWRINDLSGYDPNEIYDWIVADSDRMEWRLIEWNGTPDTHGEIPTGEGLIINNAIDTLSYNQFPEIRAGDPVAVSGGPNRTKVVAGFPDIIIIQGRWWTL